MAANERDNAESTEAAEAVATPAATPADPPAPTDLPAAAPEVAAPPHATVSETATESPAATEPQADTAAALETPVADATEQETEVVEAPAPDETAAEAAAEEAAGEESAPEEAAEGPRSRQAQAGDTAAADQDESSAADPFAIPADPLALIFQAPDLSTIPPAPRKRRDDRPDTADATDTSGGEDESEDRDGGDSEGQQSGSRSSRRRRRSRGRSGGSGGGDQGGAQEDDSDRTPDATESQGDGHGSAEEDQQGGTEDDGDGTGTRRRRKRRRGEVDMELEGGAGDDPENTVTRVRAPRQSASTGPQGVTGLKGSTRLEAKKQRRRDSRSGGRQRRHVITEAEFLARRESVDRKMLVRQREHRIQIAVMEDGVLAEHFVSNTTQDSMIGNVYLGKVQNVLPSMEAAFVDIGRGRNAVLYAGEVNWDAANLEGKARKIENALKSGDSVLVQVTKDPVGHKGARLTSQISLPGRYLVYVPGGSMTGISRKLPDVERSRLKKVLKDHLPENAGVIVRTAAEGTSEQELMNDINRLRAQWEGIEARSKSTKTLAPELLYSEPDLTIKVVRDVFNEDFSGMIVQGPDVWDNIEAYVTYVAPHLLDRIQQWKPEDHDGEDLFASNRIDEQLHKALERKVFLPSGGSLVIDRTEAMTVVDVNTGKFTGSGGNLEETVTKNNLEAAEEIVRQLRLRDIGGIIVIDFIDMVLESNRDLVLRRLVECLGRDRTKHQVAEVTSLGLVQMTRKRMGTGLVEIFSETCEHCNGRGIIIHDVPVEHRRAHNAQGEPRSQGGSGDSGDGGGRRSSRSERRRRSRERQAERERETQQEASTGAQPSPEEEAERKARAEAARAAFANIAAATHHHDAESGSGSGKGSEPTAVTTADAGTQGGARRREPQGADQQQGPTRGAAEQDQDRQRDAGPEPAQQGGDQQERDDRPRRRRSRRAGSDQGQPGREQVRQDDSAREQVQQAAGSTDRGVKEQPQGRRDDGTPTLTFGGDVVEVPRGSRRPRRASSTPDLSALESALDEMTPRDERGAPPASAAHVSAPQAPAAQAPTAPAAPAPAHGETTASQARGAGQAAPQGDVAATAPAARRRRRAASSEGSTGDIQTVDVTSEPVGGHRFSASAGTPAAGAGPAEGGKDRQSAPAAAPMIIGVGVKAEDIARPE